MPQNNPERLNAKTEKCELFTQLTEMQSKIEYDSFLFSINYIVEQFRENNFYIPKSKRFIVWSEKKQMKLIEMVLLGLPIPFLFVMSTGEEQYEVLDGSQRIQTLEAFMSNRLKLENLEILNKLNGFTFSDIHFIQQNKFKSRILETFVVDKTMPRDIAQKIATRLDSGGTPLESL